MTVTHRDRFPTDQWLTHMESSVERITALGRAMLHAHLKDQDGAAETAERFQLPQRLDQTRQAMSGLVASVREIVEAIQSCRDVVYACDRVETSDGSTGPTHQAMTHCSQQIEAALPRIESSLAQIRHSALDLLQWAQRSGGFEGSRQIEEFRASFGELVAFAPVSRPLMEALQQELLRWNRIPELHPDAQRLISAVNRFNAVVESSRAFIHSIVQPPMELVFHETDSFLTEFESLPADRQVELASAINDRCQLLLYDPHEFQRHADAVRPQLTTGVDASMVVLEVSETFRVILTADEDPLFGQLVVTLYHVVSADQLGTATANLTRSLYGHFASEPRGNDDG